MSKKDLLKPICSEDNLRRCRWI